MIDADAALTSKTDTAPTTDTIALSLTLLASWRKNKLAPTPATPNTSTILSIAIFLESITYHARLTRDDYIYSRLLHLLFLRLWRLCSCCYCIQFKAQVSEISSVLI